MTWLLSEVVLDENDRKIRCEGLKNNQDLLTHLHIATNNAL